MKCKMGTKYKRRHFFLREMQIGEQKITCSREIRKLRKREKMCRENDRGGKKAEKLKTIVENRMADNETDADR